MAEPLRSDEYGARPNNRQVERARENRQMQAGDRTPANNNDAPSSPIRNANVVRFGEVRETASTNRNNIRNAYPDTASVFNESYAQAGIQPSNIAVNTSTRKTAPSPDTSIRAASATYYQPVEEDGDDEDEVLDTAAAPAVNKRKVNSVKRELARAKATGINTLVLSIAGILFWPQIILAAISIVALGLWFLVEYLLTNSTYDASGNFSFGGWVSSKFKSLLEGVAYLLDKLTGINIIEIPSQLFFIAYGATVGIGYLILLTMYLMYSISFIKSLSGQRAALKQIAFIIALIGHAMPIMNLFPWFIFWGIVVWMYPK